MNPTFTPPLCPFLISKSVINFYNPPIRNVAKLIFRRRISLKRDNHLIPFLRPFMLASP